MQEKLLHCFLKLNMIAVKIYWGKIAILTTQWRRWRRSRYWRRNRRWSVDADSGASCCRHGSCCCGSSTEGRVHGVHIHRPRVGSTSGSSSISGTLVPRHRTEAIDWDGFVSVMIEVIHCVFFVVAVRAQLTISAGSWTLSGIDVLLLPRSTILKPNLK